MPDTHDLNFTDSPICPWCGYRLGDAWELDLHDGDTTEVDCGKCEKAYRVTASVSISYSTQRWTELDDAKEQLDVARRREKSARRMASAHEHDEEVSVWLELASRLSAVTARIEQEVAYLEAQGA
jgi:hypothetical protein